MAFRKSRTAKTGGKFLGVGETGSGKSFFGLTFPKIAAADSEAGLLHYEGRAITIDGKQYNNLEMISNTADIDELESNLDDLLSGQYDDEIQTFLIDSETKFYGAMQVAAQAVEERRARKKKEDPDDTVVSQRQWGRIKTINMKLQQAKIDLSTRGIHIVSISQETDLRDKEDTQKIIGTKPDMYKNIQYDYDTVLRFFKEKDKKTNEIRYFAEVLKDRTEVTKVGTIIENCTYDVWRDYFDGISGLDKIETSYKKDMNTSIEKMEEKSDSIDIILDEWQAIMKVFTTQKQLDMIKLISAKIKELKIDTKNMQLANIVDLKELLAYSKSLNQSS